MRNKILKLSFFLKNLVRPPIQLCVGESRKLIFGDFREDGPRCSMLNLSIEGESKRTISTNADHLGNLLLAWNMKAKNENKQKNRK